MLATKILQHAEALKSHSVAHRRRQIEGFLIIIQENPNLVKTLEDNINWDDIIEAVFTFITLEADHLKKEEDQKPQLCRKHRQNAANLLLNVVPALRGREIYSYSILSASNLLPTVSYISKLIKQVFVAFERPLVKHFFEEVLHKIVSKFILTPHTNWSRITEEQCCNLFQIIKLDSNSDGSALHSFIRWAPLHRLPAILLRDEGNFIEGICLSLKQGAPRKIQEDCLNALIYFLTYTSPDNRHTNCALGENVFGAIVELYDTSTSSASVRILILEYFHYMMKLHHCQNSPEDSALAYAESWPTWNKALRTMYSIFTQHLSRCSPRKRADDMEHVFKEEQLLCVVFALVVQQIYSKDYADVTQVTLLDSSLHPTAKRIRPLSPRIDALVDYVAGGSAGLWARCLYELLRTYPSSQSGWKLSSQDYVQLVQRLAAVQFDDAAAVKCSFDEYVFKCLILLVEMETRFVLTLTENIDRLWITVWETVTRLISFNQYPETTHGLIQSLIIRRKMPSSAVTDLLKLFIDNVLFVSHSSINTLRLLAEMITITETEVVRHLYTWLLCMNKISDVTTDKSFTEILVKLSFKDFPTMQLLIGDADKSSQDVELLDTVYELNSFESLINCDVLNADLKDQSTACLTDPKKLEILYQQTELFIIHLNNKTHAYYFSGIIESIQLATFILNLLSCFLQYEIINANELPTHILIEKLGSIFSQLDIDLESFMADDAVIHGQHINVVKQLTALLSGENLHMVICNYLKTALPSNILTSLFQRYSHSVDSMEHSDVASDLELQLTCLNAFASFAFLPEMFDEAPNQCFAAQMLFDLNLDVIDDISFDKVKVVLKAISKCKPGGLVADIMIKSYDLIQAICCARFLEFNSACFILEVLYDLFRHVAMSTNENLKADFIHLLFDIYKYRTLVGEKVSILLVKCLGLISMLDPNGTWAKWQSENDDPVFYHLADFCSSDYVRVRYTAIQNIIPIFRDTNNEHFIHEFKMKLFALVLDQSTGVLVSHRGLSQCRVDDETTTRVASVLHTYAAIMTCSCSFRAKAMFELIKVMHKTGIDEELVCKILDVVAKCIGRSDRQDLLDSNAEYLLEQWYFHQLPFDTFPFKIFNCKYSDEVLANNIGVAYPFIVTNDSLLAKICDRLCVNHDYLRTSVIYPNLRAFSVLSSAQSNVPQSMLRNLASIERFLEHAETEDLQTDNISCIFILILSKLYDPKYLKDEFNIVLPEKCEIFNSITVADFNQIKSKFERHIPEQSLPKYLLNSAPHLLKDMLVKLRSSLYICDESTATLILTQFRLGFFLDLIVKELSISNQKLWPYITREIVMSYLNIFASNIPSLASRFAWQQFGKLLRRLLPVCANQIMEFMPLIMDQCKHADGFNYVAAILSENQEIDDYISNNENTMSQSLLLTDFCAHFLNVEELIDNTDLVGNRAESLIFLNNIISSKKDELYILYENEVESMRESNVDLQSSILTRMVNSVINNVTSSDEEISIAASRCLSELSPVTNILMFAQKPEFVSVKPGSSFEQLLNYAIVALGQYLTSRNIQVVNIANNIMPWVLRYPEANKILTINKKLAGFLVPYLPRKPVKGTAGIDIDEDVFDSELDTEDIWFGNKSFETWITELVCKIMACFKNKLLLNFVPLCKHQLCFTERVFPILIMMLINHGSRSVAQRVLFRLKQFLKNHCLEFLNQSEETISSQRMAMYSILSFVHLSRLNHNYKRKIVVDFDWNYLHLALAAYNCNAYHSAILYSEMWCFEIQTSLQNAHTGPSPEYTSNLSTCFDFVYLQSDPDQRKVLETVIRNSYHELNEPNAIAGFDSSFALNNCQTLASEMDWLRDSGCPDRMLLLADMQLTTAVCNKSDITAALLDLRQVLKQNNLYETLNLVDQSQNDNWHTNYDILWRLSKWDAPIQKASLDSMDFDRSIFLALKGLYDGNHASTTAAINSARNNAIQAMKSSKLVGIRQIFKSLSQLQSLHDINEFSTKSLTEKLTLLENWKTHEHPFATQYDRVKTLKLQRIIMCSIMADRGEMNMCQFLVDLHLDLIQMARLNGDVNQARLGLQSLRNMCDLNKDDLEKISLEEIQVYSLSDPRFARLALSNFLGKPIDNALVNSMGLKLYGTWMGEQGSLDTRTIINDYFLKSIKILDSVNDRANTMEQILEGYDVVARFADVKYQRVHAYTQSSNFSTKKEHMEKLKTRANEFKSNPETLKVKTVKTALTICQRQHDIDSREVENTFNERSIYLLWALKYYILNLQHSDKYNRALFRVVSMWLENMERNDVNGEIERTFPMVSSHKFLPLLPQLMPHIGNGESALNRQVIAILERCAVGHPHQTLPIILAVRNAEADESYAQAMAHTECDTSRVNTALALVDRLRVTKPSLRPIIDRMQQLSEALVEFAYLVNDKAIRHDSGLKVLPKTAKLRHIVDFDDIALPIWNVPVNVNKTYNHIVGIHSFAKHYSLVGGANAPKKIEIRGTDGIVRPSLVKGLDDMRQDAVMQQVFTLMNELFLEQKNTSHLAIRTYKVVPLSKRSGILEWVVNTICFSEFLRETHKRSSKVTLSYCYSEYLKTESKTNAEKIRNFTAICSKLKPVFHKFFVKNFVDSVRWYERRRAYVHSVATSSICGYVLGIGDRHVNNILIDQKTGQIVHIDFGIAFELGHLLPTPETVPFRLTREIVDGMGVTGVEGVFRQTCEQTMHELRRSTATIIAILEVLLYDPLYTWTISATKAYSKQICDSPSDEFAPIDSAGTSAVNVTAERVLLRLRKKLQGTEDECSTTVEGQVSRLIDEARNPANLCRLFSGWQSYL